MFCSDERKPPECGGLMTRNQVTRINKQSITPVISRCLGHWSSCTMWTGRITEYLTPFLPSWSCCRTCGFTRIMMTFPSVFTAGKHLYLLGSTVRISFAMTAFEGKPNICKSEVILWPWWKFWCKWTQDTDTNRLWRNHWRWPPSTFKQEMCRWWNNNKQIPQQVSAPSNTDFK